MSAVVAEPKKPVRKRSGTAKWHMSRDAVDLSLADLHKMDDRECWKLFVEARFGSKDMVRCPSCGSIGRHYFRHRDKRWKCHGCQSTFSVTTGTVFSQHKLSLREILIGALTWINSSAGQPALELKRHVDKTYNTAFTLQAKLREALIRGYNVGLLSGDIEVDGAHQSGWLASEKRGKPQGKRLTREEIIEAVKAKGGAVTGVAQQKGWQARNEAAASTAGAATAPPLASDAPAIAADTPAVVPDTPAVDVPPASAADGYKVLYEFGVRKSKDARVVVAVRKRSGVKGRGAVQSRIAVGTTENSTVVGAVLKNFVAGSESYLNTDSHTAYGGQNEHFLEHRTVNHSEELVGPHGENNNLAEELNFRYDRAEKGVYLNIEPKYLLDYAVETAFRSDTRRATKRYSTSDRH
jgi:transposase-like protein